MSHAATKPFNACWKPDSKEASKTKSSAKSNHLILHLPYSVLVPLLFFLYINDLGNSCDSTPRLFADDTYVIAKGTCPAQLEQQLKQIAEWINANNLTINP